MRKTLTLFLTLLVSGLVLAACGQDEQPEVDPVDPEDQVSENGAAEEREEDSSDLSPDSILQRVAGLGSFQYDLVFTPFEGEEQTVSVWLKENRMRAESSFEIQGQEVQGVYFLDHDKRESIAYHPDQGMAVRMDYSESKAEVGNSPKERNQELRDRDLEVVGEEVWDGKDCVVVEYTTDTEEVRVWIWKEHGLPVRNVFTTDEGEMIAELRNIEFVDIPDSQLELPEGAQVIDVPTF